MLLGQGNKKNWRVVYPGGEKTEPMNKRTAKDYAKMFGGSIEKIKKNKINKSTKYMQ